MRGIFLLGLVMGCDGKDDTEDQAPLREGTWNERANALNVNSCPMSEDDLNIGSTYLIYLTSTADEVTFLDEYGEVSNTYSIQGDTFSGEDSELQELSDLCYLRFDGSFTSDIIGEEYFETLLEIRLSTEGDCSGLDTTGFPCTVEVALTEEWVGELP